ncbi:noeI, partial [Symbiodinium microadriaticum]
DGCFGPAASPLHCCKARRPSQCPGVSPEGPCCQLRARSGAVAPRPGLEKATGHLLRLKLRLVACAHARVAGTEPEACGPRCLALLSSDLEEILRSGPKGDATSGRLSFQEEVAAAALCFRLLLFRHQMQKSGDNFGKNLPMKFLQEFAFLWEMSHFLNWQHLLESGWPVFGLFRLVAQHWPRSGTAGDETVRRTHRGNATASVCDGPSSKLRSSLEAMGSDIDGEGLRVPGVGEPKECGWQESLGKLLMTAWLIYNANSYRYHMYNGKSFAPLEDMPFYEMVLHRSWEQSLLGLTGDASQGQRGTVETAAQLLQSRWDPWDLLSSLEVLHLHRSWRLFKEILPVQPVIVEAGANDGIHEAIWLQEWPTAQIMAFEPDPTCFAHLTRNLREVMGRANPNSKLLNMALSGKVGQMDFYLRDGNFSTSAVNTLHEPTDWFNEHFPQISWQRETVKVQTMPLDSLAFYDVHAVDFLELDVQCHEYNVLQASIKILPTITIMQIEACLPPGMCKGTALYEDIRSLLTQRGFSLLATDAKPDSLLHPQDRCFDAFFVNLAKEPTGALAALDVARGLDAR